MKKQFTIHKYVEEDYARFLMNDEDIRDELEVIYHSDYDLDRVVGARVGYKDKEHEKYVDGLFEEYKKSAPKSKE